MKEIDIRALLNGKIDSKFFIEQCSSFGNISTKTTNEDLFINKLIIRNFNGELTWSTTKQTNFIESIFIGCEIPAIIIFQVSTNPIKYLLVDGLNRVLTIKRFLSSELKLCKNGLQKTSFLEGKRFSDLTEEERDYFLARTLQILQYNYKTEEINLSNEEINAIAKQLYIRYNSGIKLKNEEIQKADYQDDYITQILNKKIKNTTMIEKLKTIYLTPKKECKTYIEKTLMNSRLAITSCYAPLELYCKQTSPAKRIDMFYRDYTLEINKDNILNEFEEITSCLYEVVKKDCFKTYPELHNIEFILVSYWMLFIIKKNHLMDLTKFDWSNYITFFGNKEKNNPIFSYFRINLITRYNAIRDYIKEVYSIDLYNYIPKEKQVLKSKINNFHDIPKYNFLLIRDTLKINLFLDMLKRNSFILRPSYQRREINDKIASSFLLESVLLNLRIPDILIYRHKNEEGNTIFEVVDGQQRCWSLLAFLEQTYTNIYGEEIISEKNGFSLTGLTILSELNGKKAKSIKNNINIENLEKIKNGEIRIVYIPEEDNPYFSAKDYFTRINKTIKPLKKTSYRYWNVKYDSILMDKANKIGYKYSELLLPKMDSKYLPQQYVVNFSYLFYKNIKNIKGFSAQQVSNWLYNFEKIKSEYFINNQEEEIATYRYEYEKSFEKVDLFLNKIYNWLKQINRSINDLICIKYNKSFSNLLIIYYLLHDINEADLLNEAENIYLIVNNFFKEYSNKNFHSDEDYERLKNCKDNLSPFFTRTIKQNQFKEELNKLINSY